MEKAINVLEEFLLVLENNAPINESEGNIDQAKLERDTAESIKKALTVLREENGRTA